MKKLSLLIGLVLVYIVFSSASDVLPLTNVSISVDFTDYSVERPVVTFIGDEGQGTFVFDYQNGNYQTKLLPDGFYTISLSINPIQSTSCQVYLWGSDAELVLPESPGAVSEPSVNLQPDTFIFGVECR